MDQHIIVGVHIMEREKYAESVQQVFTKYGTQIKTRLGLHDIHEGFSSSSGLILLEMLDTAESQQMIAELEALDGVDTQKMIFPLFET